MHKLLALALMALFLSTSSASAHKVIMSVYKSGDVVEGELGFSNGDMAADQLVEVFDEQGNKLGETTTDADGYFTYAQTTSVTHVFRAELGSGHIGEATMTATELPNAAGGATASTGASGGASQTAETGAVDEAVVAKMLRDELRPLRREIAAYKEKNDLQTILGGIGYIVGLFGFAMYIAARRKLNGAAA
jgi:nickel transport protein